MQSIRPGAYEDWVTAVWAAQNAPRTLRVGRPPADRPWHRRPRPGTDVGQTAPAHTPRSPFGLCIRLLWSLNATCARSETALDNNGMQGTLTCR